MLTYKSDVLKKIEVNLTIDLDPITDYNCIGTEDYIDPFIRSRPRSYVPYFMCRAFNYRIKGEIKRQYKIFCHDKIPQDLEPLANDLSDSDDNNIEDLNDFGIEQEHQPSITRRRLFIMLSVLKMAFENQYDFVDNCESTNFSRIEDINDARKTINEILTDSMDLFYANDNAKGSLLKDFWLEVENIVKIERSEFYTFKCENFTFSARNVKNNPFKNDNILGTKNVIIYCRNPRRIIIVCCFRFNNACSPPIWSDNYQYNMMNREK